MFQTALALDRSLFINLRRKGLILCTSLLSLYKMKGLLIILYASTISLVLLYASTVNSQPPQPPPPPTNPKVQSTLCDREERGECDNRTVQRFGCCPQKDFGGQRSFDDHDDLNDPVTGLPQEAQFNCSDPGGNCIQIADLYKNQTNVEDVECGNFTRRPGVDNRGSRCRRQRQLVRSTYYNLKLYSREQWIEKFVADPTLGKKCDQKLYNDRGLSEIWRRFILCPFDREYLDKMIDPIIEEAIYYPGLMEKLCLKSPNMEECVNGTCQCLRIEENIYRGPTANDTYVFNFTQIEEGKFCAQAAGNTCTFNVRDLFNASSTPPGTPPTGYRPASDVYRMCTISGNKFQNESFLPIFECEKDAACESKTSRCGLERDCFCKCVEGYQCSKETGGAGSIHFQQTVAVALIKMMLTSIRSISSFFVFHFK